MQLSKVQLISSIMFLGAERKTIDRTVTSSLAIEFGDGGPAFIVAQPRGRNEKYVIPLDNVAFFIYADDGQLAAEAQSAHEAQEREILRRAAELAEKMATEEKQRQIAQIAEQLKVGEAEAADLRKGATEPNDYEKLTQTDAAAAKRLSDL